ncbi:MAG: hypothetical protein FJY73_13105 [Candidatus Eisenbacteria bacterium]|nr:hypothetical protein [Candidatus Eisenbacteria bacterium]
MMGSVHRESYWVRKAAFVVLGIFLALPLSCVTQPGGPSDSPISFDLVVLVTYEGEPVGGVLVRVLETGAEAYTDAYGRTPTLAVESNAQTATIFVKYGQIQTTRMVSLRRGMNEVVIRL